MSILSAIKRAKSNLNSELRQVQTSNNGGITTKIDSRIKGLDNEKLAYWQQLPFWSTNHRSDGKCCFVDLVGRPIKNGEECPLYPFETDTIIPAFEQHNKIFILKSRGLGCTTLALYYMLHKSQQREYANSTMAIVVGPSHRTASDLIKVCRNILQRRLGITVDSRETELILPNNVNFGRSLPTI